MTNARFVVLAITVFLLPIAPTMAEDRPTDAQCRNFADFAVRNAQKVRNLNCTTLPWNDASLSLDKDRHFRWCRMMRTETVEKQMEVLVAQSDKCEYCREYEETINFLLAEVRDLRFRPECRKTLYNPDGRWFYSVGNSSNTPHARCMAYEEVISGRHYYDAARTKSHYDQVLGEMVHDLAQCKVQIAKEATRSVSIVPTCQSCHGSQTPAGFTPSALHPAPKRVGGDATIARQPPAFTSDKAAPSDERRRTPRETGRSTSSGSDQVSPRGAPAGSSGSAMDRLGGSGAGGAPSGGGGSGGAAAKPSGSGGGASSAPSSAGSPAPNINSNTIKQQAPAFGQTPGLR